jgi:hypothetical protein
MTTPSISQQTVLGARAPACVTGLGQFPDARAARDLRDGDRADRNPIGL